jgi:hypothetical protein
MCRKTDRKGKWHLALPKNIVGIFVGCIVIEVSTL